MDLSDGIGARLRACGAGCEGFIVQVAVFIQHAVVVNLLQCVPVAIIMVIADGNTVLNVGDYKGVNKVSLALVLLVAISSLAKLFSHNTIITYRTSR